MSEKLKEFTDIPQEFVRDGRQVRVDSPPLAVARPHAPPQFLTRCTKPSQKGDCLSNTHTVSIAHITVSEFLQICKAVAIGFAVMGFIGYFVKLIHIPMYVFCHTFS